MILFVLIYTHRACVVWAKMLRDVSTKASTIFEHLNIDTWTFFLELFL